MTSGSLILFCVIISAFRVLCMDVFPLFYVLLCFSTLEYMTMDHNKMFVTKKSKSSY